MALSLIEERRHDAPQSPLVVPTPCIPLRPDERSPVGREQGIHAGHRRLAVEQFSLDRYVSKLPEACAFEICRPKIGIQANTGIPEIFLLLSEVVFRLGGENDKSP